MIHLDPYPYNPRRIMWLASYPRSGNTWVRIFLATLLNIITDRREGTSDFNRVDEFSFSESSAPLYAPFLDFPVDQASPEQIAAVRPKVHRSLVEKAAGIIPLKTHNANAVIFGFPTISQDLSAGAIYIIRNPLDVAISFARFRDVPIDQMITELGSSGFYAGTTEDHVFELTGSWSEHVLTWTAKENPSLLIVRYEDMLETPTETFRAIADHVLMSCTPEQLATAIDQTSFRQLQSKEEQTGFKERPDTTERFFRAGRIGQWRDVLTPDQVNRIVADHEQQMHRFGYLPT